MVYCNSLKFVLKTGAVVLLTTPLKGGNGVKIIITDQPGNGLTN